MRLYVFLTFLIVCILAVNAVQQNQSHANKRNQLAKKKATSGNAVINSNHHLKAKPRSASKPKVRKVKPALARRPKKVVRRVVKKSNRRSGVPAKKIARKNGNRNTIRRNSRGSRKATKRLAKQELSDSTENKSIGAGQANGGDLDTSSGDKPQDTVSQSASPSKPAAAPAPAVPAAQPAAAKPAAAPVAAPAPSSTGDSSSTNLLASPAQGANPLSSPFNIPKSNGQNQAIGAAFSQSSNGGSAFAAGFASINGAKNTAGGYGQVNSGKQASNPNSENLNANTAEEPVASDNGSSTAEEGSGELAAYRRRPQRG